MLDCGCIAHHNDGKPGAVEGFRLLADAKDLRAALIDPLESFKLKTYTYITGNHERFLTDLSEKIPGLEDLLDVRRLLNLSDKWKVIPQGGLHRVGKLVFLHGDTVRGGEQAAKSAVIDYERNVRFGHFHTFQVYTKTSPVDHKLAKTGIAVPCLCTKDPKYGEGKPNRWVQGFLYGYLHPDGTFNDTVVVITEGKATIHGKVHKG